MTSSQETQVLERGLRLNPRFDDKGLICAIAQDAMSKDVIMVAWMNSESLALTLETGIAHYWSRSRQELWKKGETSGQLQYVKAIFVDCDQDALVLQVEVGGDGGCCHVGFKSCFYRAVTDKDGTLIQTQDDPPEMA
jgi:phosphoribosyl-AMP cyclohydrolase